MSTAPGYRTPLDSLDSWEYTGILKSILGKYLDKFWYWDSLEKISGRFKYLNSLKTVVVVVVVALADGCSFPEIYRTFHKSTQKL